MDVVWLLPFPRASSSLTILFLGDTIVLDGVGAMAGFEGEPVDSEISVEAALEASCPFGSSGWVELVLALSAEPGTSSFLLTIEISSSFKVAGFEEAGSTIASAVCSFVLPDISFGCC